jgi:hypothetical protein
MPPVEELRAFQAEKTGGITVDQLRTYKKEQELGEKGRASNYLVKLAKELPSDIAGTFYAATEVVPTVAVGILATVPKAIESAGFLTNAYTRRKFNDISEAIGSNKRVNLLDLAELKNIADRYNAYPENVKNYFRGRAYTHKTPTYGADLTWGALGKIGEIASIPTEYFRKGMESVGWAFNASPEGAAILDAVGLVTGDVATGYGAAEVAKIPGAIMKAPSYKAIAVDREVKKFKQNIYDNISASEDSMRILDNSIHLQQKIPELKLDLASATGSEYVAAKREALFTTGLEASRERALAISAQQKEHNKNVINKFSKGITKDGETQKVIEAITTQADGSYASIVNGINNEIRKNQTVLDRIQIDIEKFGTVDKNRGALIQKKQKEQLELAKAKSAIEFKAFGNPNIDISNSYKLAAKTLADSNIWEKGEIPTVVRQILDRGKTAFDSVATNKELLNKAIEQEQKGIFDYSSAGAVNKLNSLIQKRQALDSGQVAIDMPLQEMKDLLSLVSRQTAIEKVNLKSETNAGAAGTRIGHLTNLKEQLLFDMKKMAENNPDLAKDVQAYHAAIDSYKKNVLEKYRDGYAGDVLLPKAWKGEEFVMAGEEVTNGMMTKSVSVDEFKAWADLQYEHSETLLPFKLSIVDRYRKEVVTKDKTGASVYDPSAHNKFFEKYGAKLDTVPDIRDELKNINTAAKTVDRALELKNIRLKSLQDQYLYKLIDTKNPADFFNKLSSSSGADEILKQAIELNVPHASIKRFVGAYILGKSKNYSTSSAEVFSPANINKTIEENPGFRKVLGKDGIDNIKLIMEASYRNDYKIVHKFNQDGESLLKQKTGVSESEAAQLTRMSLVYNLVSPVWLAQTVVLKTLARANKNEIERLNMETILDTDLQKIRAELIKAKTEKEEAALAMKMAEHMKSKGTWNKVFQVSTKGAIGASVQEAGRISYDTPPIETQGNY